MKILAQQSKSSGVRPSVWLSSYDMGEVTEDDFDNWAQFVSEHIEEKCGFAVEVDQKRFGDAGNDQIESADENKIDSVNDALRMLWEEWCDGGDTMQTMLRLARQSLANPQLVATDRGTGSAGPMALDADEEIDDRIMGVTAQEDAEAWELARAAHRALCGGGEPTHVWVGSRGETNYQRVYSVEVSS